MRSCSAPARTARIDFTLEVKTAAEQVTVEAQNRAGGTPKQGNISGKIQQVELKELPLNGKQRIQPPGPAGRHGGAAGAPARPAGGGRVGQTDPVSPARWAPTVYANGLRQESNSFTMDGVSINSGPSPGFTNVTPTEAAVQEVPAWW